MPAVLPGPVTPPPPPPIVPEPAFPSKKFIILLLLFLFPGLIIIPAVTLISFVLPRSADNSPVYRPVTPTPVSVNGYYTFNYPDLGISFSLPAGYVTRTLGDALQISNHPDFDQSEFAAIITVRSPVPDTFKASNDPHILTILDQVGYSRIYSRFNYTVAGNFLGDPPWGYYQIAILPQPMLPNGLFIQIRLHRQDEIPISEGGTAGRLAGKIAQIISSFDSTSVSPDLGLSLPPGLETTQLEYSFPQEIAGVRFLRFQKSNMNTSVHSSVLRSGILFAHPGDTTWQILYEIIDLTNSRNNPAAFWLENGIYYSVIVDANGGGSGEGRGKLTSLNPRTGIWKIESLFYYSVESFWRYISTLPSDISLSQAVKDLSARPEESRLNSGYSSNQFRLEIGNLPRLPASVTPTLSPD